MICLVYLLFIVCNDNIVYVEEDNNTVSNHAAQLMWDYFKV
jgi:hypothetical protein